MVQGRVLIPLCGPDVLTVLARMGIVSVAKHAAARGVRVAALFGAVAAACGEGAGPTVWKPDACMDAIVPYPDGGPVGDTRHVHDPEIVKDGDAHYVLSTNDGIPIRRSLDGMKTWQFLGRVFPDQLPSWATSQVPGVEAPWAPGVARFNGRFHLYYSLSTFGSPRSAIGLATNVTLDPSAPDYEWKDRGKVLESFAGDDHNAIDAAVVEDETGGLWLTWGSWGGGIKMRALDRGTGLLSPSHPTMYSLARRPAEQAVEAPYIVRRGEYFYLFVSFGLCCRGTASTYTVRVGRSESVTGPYLDRGGEPMTQGGGSLVMAAYGRVRGPGHASLVAEDGEYLLVHHYYDASDDGTPHLQIRPLSWDDGGWPLAGLPYNGEPLGPPPVEIDLSGSWAYWAGDEVAREVQLLADGGVEACDREGRWSYSAPMVTVEWDAGDSGPARVDRSVIAADGRSLVGRTSMGEIVRGNRHPAGF